MGIDMEKIKYIFSINEQLDTEIKKICKEDCRFSTKVSFARFALKKFLDELKKQNEN